MMHSITNSTLFDSVFIFSAYVCGLAAGLTVAWEEDDQFQGNMISVPPEIYTKGCVRDVDDGLAVSMSGQSHHNILTFAFVIPFHRTIYWLNYISCGVSLQWAEKIGYPVVIKASEGGGGKGIRTVENYEDFPSLYRQVCPDSYRIFTHSCMSNSDS